MALLPEIADIFGRLAVSLNSPTEEEEYSVDLSISRLSQSLNLTDTASVRVLDTTLSLMCFRAPQVFDEMIQHLVKTVVSALSSTSKFTMLRFENEEALQTNCFASRSEMMRVVDFVVDVIPKLKERGMRCGDTLLNSVLRAFIATTSYTYVAPSACIHEVDSVEGWENAISKLLCLLPEEESSARNEIPMRLLSWYIDPMCLKKDITNILQESVKRPFLSLTNSFFFRLDWRYILVCLVFSPVMFISARALLHDWFLMTSLGSILDLLTALVAATLDVISAPVRWGMSMDLGSELPFSVAYFPCENRLLRILVGPLSCENFELLVRVINDSTSHGYNQSAMKVRLVDHTSAWALAISFPEWFYFASVLLFQGNVAEENFVPNHTLGENKIQDEVGNYIVAAANYLSWILSPIDRSYRGLLFDNLGKLSRSLKQRLSRTTELRTMGSGKKFNKPRYGEQKEAFSIRKESIVALWLKEFHEIMKLNDVTPKNRSDSMLDAPTDGYTVFRRIPLGLLIGCSRNIKDDDYELLLHYAATGRIHTSAVATATKMKRGRQNSVDTGESVLGIEYCEAVAGASLVFNTSDTVEEMSVFLSDEEDGLDIIYRVKLRAGRFLTKCIKRLIQGFIDEEKVQMLTDLPDRLLQWKHQGQEVLEISEDLDDAINSVKLRLSSIAK